MFNHKRQIWFLLISVMMAVGMTLILMYTDLADPDRLSHAQTVSRWVVNGCIFIVGLFSIGYWLLVGFRISWRIPGLKLWPCMGTLLLLRAVVMFLALSGNVPLFIGPELYFGLHLLGLTVFASMILLLAKMARFAWKKCPEGLDAVIVLGCLSESRVLFARADAAVEYLRNNPDTVAVCSGGQGSNETISEAKSIQGRLIAQGIEACRLLLEDQSRNTVQNLTFSAGLLPESTRGVAVVTDDYHQYRARYIAHTVLKVPVYGIPVHTSQITMIHYLVKEYFSFLLLLAKRAVGKHD